MGPREASNEKARGFAKTSPAGKSATRAQPGDTLLASYRLSRSDTGSAGTSVISPQQIDPTGVTAGQAWIWNGSSYVAG